MARRQHSPVSGLCLAIGTLFTVLAAPAWSEDPRDLADESFDQFARFWMDSVQELGVPAHPAIMIDDVSLHDRNGVVTIRRYANEFTTELRKTSRDGAEYVGILHYNESIFNCREDDTENCSEPSTVPVTEIFRYDEGRWIY